jgi:hypothetical protein
VQRSELDAEHVLQVPPAVPHADVDCGSHTLPLQQPVGHEEALHTQAPPTQACPIAHWLLGPQPQLPPAHESARPAAQPMHVAPPVPHCVVEGTTHVVPLQHPSGHELASHTQAPPTHSWPLPQGAPVPHLQAPAEEHPSDFSASHEMQALPPTPQAVIERGLQLGPEQHPVAQFMAQPEHVPLLQVSPDGQLAHALPPLPHWVSPLPASHTLPLQHPVHEVRSHTQLPLRQRCPVPHAAPEPHWHTPPVEQLSETWLSHGAHATPGAPQAKVDSDVQVFPAQHP